MQVRNDGIPTLNSWEEAHTYWASIKPWRGRGDNERPLAKGYRHKDHLTIRTGIKEEIICRMYRTNVATYHKSGEIDIVGYESVSTGVVLDALLPRDVCVMCAIREPTIWLNGFAWSLDNNEGYLMDRREATIKKGSDGWSLVSTLKPYEWSTLNRKKANAALKARGFEDFSSYLKARCAFECQPAEQTGYRKIVYHPNWSEVDVYNAMSFVPRMRERDLWAQFVKMPNLADCIGELLEQIRTAVYRHDECIDTKLIDSVSSYKQLQSIMRSQW